MTTNYRDATGSQINADGRAGMIYMIPRSPSETVFSEPNNRIYRGCCNQAVSHAINALRRDVEMKYMYRLDGKCCFLFLEKKGR